MLALEDRKLKRAKEQDADSAEDVDGDDKPTGVMNAMHNNIDNSEVCATGCCSLKPAASA